MSPLSFSAKRLAVGADEGSLKVEDAAKRNVLLPLFFIKAFAASSFFQSRTLFIQ